MVKQEDDAAASDDDQMVICEDPQPEIDLKCKDKMADSDNDVPQEDDGEKKNYTQGRFSPTNGQNVKTDLTCRPKPIKGKKNSKRKQNMCKIRGKHQRCSEFSINYNFFIVIF